MAAYLTDAKLETLENQMGYAFRDRRYLREALTAPGAVDFELRDRNMIEGNKRLAIVGDGLIRSIISLQWYARGDLRFVVDETLKDVACNENLAEKAQQNGLDAFIHKHHGQCGPLGRRTLADTMEAIIGAVFFDCKDFDSVSAVMKGLGLF